MKYVYLSLAATAAGRDNRWRQIDVNSAVECYFYFNDAADAPIREYLVFEVDSLDRVKESLVWNGDIPEATEKGVNTHVKCGTVGSVVHWPAMPRDGSTELVPAKEMMCALLSKIKNELDLGMPVMDSLLDLGDSDREISSGSKTVSVGRRYLKLKSQDESGCVPIDLKFGSEIASLGSVMLDVYSKLGAVPCHVSNSNPEPVETRDRNGKGMFKCFHANTEFATLGRYKGPNTSEEGESFCQGVFEYVMSERLLTKLIFPAKAVSESSRMNDGYVHDIEAWFTLNLDGRTVEFQNLVFDLAKLDEWKRSEFKRSIEVETFSTREVTSEHSKDQMHYVDVTCKDIGSLSYGMLETREDPQSLMSPGEMCYMLSVLHTDLKEGTTNLDYYLDQEWTFRHLFSRPNGDENAGGIEINSLSTELSLKNLEKSTCITWSFYVGDEPPSPQQRLVDLFRDLTQPPPCEAGTHVSTDVAVTLASEGIVKTINSRRISRLFECSHKGVKFGATRKSFPVDSTATEKEQTERVKATRDSAYNEARKYCSSFFVYIKSYPVLDRLMRFDRIVSLPHISVAPDYATLIPIPLSQFEGAYDRKQAGYSSSPQTDNGERLFYCYDRAFNPLGQVVMNDKFRADFDRILGSTDAEQMLHICAKLSESRHADDGSTYFFDKYQSTAVEAKSYNHDSYVLTVNAKDVNEPFLTIVMADHDCVDVKLRVDHLIQSAVETAWQLPLEIEDPQCLKQSGTGDQGVWASCPNANWAWIWLRSDSSQSEVITMCSQIETFVKQNRALLELVEPTSSGTAHSSSMKTISEHAEFEKEPVHPVAS